MRLLCEWCRLNCRKCLHHSATAECLKLASVCLNDNITVDPAAFESQTTPVDIPAECVRLIFTLNVISTGKGAESTESDRE